jgi:hypothetical protein
MVVVSSNCTVCKLVYICVSVCLENKSTCGALKRICTVLINETVCVRTRESLYDACWYV